MMSRIGHCVDYVIWAHYRSTLRVNLAIRGFLANHGYLHSSPQINSNKTPCSIHGDETVITWIYSLKIENINCSETVHPKVRTCTRVQCHQHVVIDFVTGGNL